jgi:TetR/AcrR family fatty acid metabolism transcriptional regulator
VPARVAFPTERILDTAGRLFGDRRFHEVRMEDIAAEAEVGKGTLYRYFRDKDELFLALLERAAKQLLERATAQLAPVCGARAKLVVLVDTIIGYFDEHAHLLDLIQRAEVLRGRNMPWQEARDELLKLMLQVCDDGRERGEFDVVDAELGTLLVLAGLRGVLRCQRPPRPPGLAERIVDHFLHGYNRATTP